MLDRIVRYLHDTRTPFRLASYPSLEELPKAAHHLPSGGVLVEAQVVLVDDRLVLACYPAGGRVDLRALGLELSGIAVEVRAEDLPESLQGMRGSPPPLGELFGLPVVLDEAVSNCAVLVFQPFGESDFLELPFDDFARLEHPRMASFTRAGALCEASAAP
jgi:Ala-tRNA(Pro) deacylase